MKLIRSLGALLYFLQRADGEGVGCEDGSTTIFGDADGCGAQDQPCEAQFTGTPYAAGTLLSLTLVSEIEDFADAACELFPAPLAPRALSTTCLRYEHTIFVTALAGEPAKADPIELSENGVKAICLGPCLDGSDLFTGICQPAAGVGPSQCVNEGATACNIPLYGNVTILEIPDQPESTVLSTEAPGGGEEGNAACDSTNQYEWTDADGCGTEDVPCEAMFVSSPYTAGDLVTVTITSTFEATHDSFCQAAAPLDTSVNCEPYTHSIIVKAVAVDPTTYDPELSPSAMGAICLGPCMGSALPLADFTGVCQQAAEDETGCVDPGLTACDVPLIGTVTHELFGGGGGEPTEASEASEGSEVSSVGGEGPDPTEAPADSTTATTSGARGIAAVAAVVGLMAAA